MFLVNIHVNKSKQERKKEYEKLENGKAKGRKVKLGLENGNWKREVA